MTPDNDETIRVFFELKNMAQVRAVLAFAETMDLTMRMAPVIQRRVRGPGLSTIADGLPINKLDKFKIGPPVNLPKDSEAEGRYPIVARILGDKSMEYRELTTRFQKNAHVDRRRAGFTLSFLIRAGALVRADE